MAMDVFRNGLAEKFGISYVRAVDGLVWVAEDEGKGSGRKWYKPEQASALSDQVNAFAKGIYALGDANTQSFKDACELAAVLADAARLARAQRELSKGTGNLTEQVEKQLTPLPGHVLDWNGADKKVLDGLVELASGMFKELDVGAIGDVMMMADAGGERKLGALRIMDQFKSSGKNILPRVAVGMYDDLKSGRLVLPSSMGL